MKKMLLKALVAFGVMSFTAGISSTVLAEPATGPNGNKIVIGVIDVETIMSRAPQVQAINQSLQKEFSEREKKIIAMQKSLDEAKNKYARDKAIMSESQAGQAESQIMADNRSLVRLEEDLRLDKSFEYQQAMKKFGAQVKIAIDKVAKQKQITLIFQKGTLPYADPSIDVTEEILKTLLA